MLKKWFMLLLAAVWLHGYAGELPIVLWDNATISDSAQSAHRITAQIIYSTQPLERGQSITAFVPLGKSYRVICCVKVKDGQSMTAADLIKKYPADLDFAKRVRAIKGAKFAYEALIAPDDQLNKNMKLMVADSEGPYYSAVGLVGFSADEKIKGQSFNWDGYGKISIKTQQAPHGLWRHTVSGEKWSSSIEEPALPD
jgi:hypothetical protein